MIIIILCVSFIYSCHSFSVCVEKRMIKKKVIEKDTLIFFSSPLDLLKNSSHCYYVCFEWKGREGKGREGKRK